MIFQLLSHDYKTSRPAPTRCQLDTCGRITREGKKYCDDHIEYNDHANQVITDLARFEEENKAIAQGKLRTTDIVETNVAQEIMTYIRFAGPSTVERVIRELNIRETTVVLRSGDIKIFPAEDLTIAAAKALGRTKKLKFARNKRHKVVLVPMEIAK